MIENMLKALIPGMLLKLGDIKREDKIALAQYMDALALAYLQNRRADFDVLMSKLTVPDDMKTRIAEALWK